MALLDDLRKFLREYRVIAITVAFVISLAALNFIQSFVNDIVLPILRPIISPESPKWEEIVFSIGPINLRVGTFLSASISLLLTVIILYVIVDRILHWKPKK